MDIQLDRNSSVPLSWHQFFNSNIAYANQHSIMDIMNSAVNKNSISFSGGIGDPELYPTKDIKNLQKNLWKTHESHMLTHCPVQGHYPFRESICDLLKTKNISASPKDIMVLSGSMQGIDFIGRAFIIMQAILYLLKNQLFWEHFICTIKFHL